MPVTYRELGAEQVRAKVRELQAKPEEQKRRAEYSRRVLILKDRFAPLIHQRIIQVYQKSRSHEQLLKFVSVGTNVCNRVVRELAFVYQRPPTRRLRIDGRVGELANERLAAANRESGIAVKAKQWGQYAFALNIVWVLPGVWDRVGGKRLEYQLVLPHTAERITSDDPNYTDILLWPTGDGGWQAVDGEAYYWLDDQFAPRRIVPHMLGRQPAIPLRVSEPPPGDFWDIGRGHRLAESTIECGRIAAVMSWVRQAQNRKLVTVFGELEGLDRDQVGSPESAITGKTDAGPEAISFTVHDFETSVSEFKAEMRWHIEQVTESYGVPITTVDPEPASTGDAVNVFAPAGPQLHAAQSELRDDQIEFARPFDLELAVVTHELLARHRHPASISPALVAETYEARWQPLSFVDHPLRRLDVYERKMALGLMTHADAMIEEYGDMTPTEAHDLVLANLADKAEIDLFYAEHNVGIDPRVSSIAQIQGRAGGQAAADNQGQAA